MLVVGGNANIEEKERKCLICSTGAMETAEHFAADCPAYAIERADCLQRIEQLLGHRGSPLLRQAVQNADPVLFLGDALLRRLPDAIAKAVNSSVCNFLMAAWEVRKPLWAKHCEEGTEWKLKE